MPVKTMVQAFLFLPHSRLNIAFRYHALHDIESAWWLGIWMLHFFKPARHEESSESLHLRRVETIRRFPGTLTHHGRLTLIAFDHELINTTLRWIAEELEPAVQILNNIRLLLLQIYRDLERTFPDNLPMLSSQADPATNAAFPDGLVSDIHGPIENLFLAARNEYRDTAIVSVFSNE